MSLALILTIGIIVYFIVFPDRFSIYLGGFLGIFILCLLIEVISFWFDFDFGCEKWMSILCKIWSVGGFIVGFFVPES